MINYNKYKILLSTGMSDIKEIVAAINTIVNCKVYSIRRNKIEIKNKKINMSRVWCAVSGEASIIFL